MFTKQKLFVRVEKVYRKKKAVDIAVIFNNGAQYFHIPEGEALELQITQEPEDD